MSEQVFRRVRETRSFLKTLKMRSAELIEHIQCYNGLLSRIIEDIVKGNIIAKGDRHYVGRIARVCYYELTIVVLRSGGVVSNQLLGY